MIKDLERTIVSVWNIEAETNIFKLHLIRNKLYRKSELEEAELNKRSQTLFET